jgi:uncharacterized protein YyaL (SSP411 family)
MDIFLFTAIFEGLKRPKISPDDNRLYREHLKAAASWIQRAYDASGDGGISKGYDLLRNRWMPSYPETTGYSIPTLLNTKVYLNQPDLQTLALTLANYLLKVATLEGGVGHWQDKVLRTPIVFDTGQVIFGWLAAYKFSHNEQYLEAAKHSGDWLLSVQDRSGSWKKNQHLGVEKVIDTRVSWALVELYLVTKQEEYLQAAIRNLDWSLQQQEPDGWFKHCSFRDGVDPFTHTIAYTIEGLLECGFLLKKANYLESAQRSADALLGCQRVDGSLSSTYSPGWRASSHSCCLTGLCQISRLWLRFYEISGNNNYIKAAKKGINYVACTQSLNLDKPNFYGAISGSYPVFGRYERFKYPNWATKFFIDSILKLDEIGQGKNIFAYVG